MRLNQTLVAIAVASICGQGVALAAAPVPPNASISKDNWQTIFGLGGGRR